MRILYIYIIMMMTALIITACSSSRDNTSTETPATAVAIGYSSQPSANQARYIPKAVIYRTNGDYDRNVFVNLSPDRTQIASYPAVTDITPDSSPVPLGDGWLLDRRGGIGPNSAFLTYTWSQYAALDRTPSPKQLLESIIPNAHVTQVVTLPITVNEAISNPDRARQYIPKD